MKKKEKKTRMKKKRRKKKRRKKKRKKNKRVSEVNSYLRKKNENIENVKKM